MENIELAYIELGDIRLIRERNSCIGLGFSDSSMFNYMFSYATKETDSFGNAYWDRKYPENELLDEMLKTVYAQLLTLGLSEKVPHEQSE